MEFKETVGIDVSKKTLDVRIHKQKSQARYENNAQEIKKMVKWVFASTGLDKEQVLFVYEHTDLYSNQLTATLSELGIKFSIVSGLEIKRSMGLVRGKNDQKDAAMIARYAYRLREEIELTQMPSKKLLSLKRLLSLRDRLVKQRAGYKASYKEHKRILKKKDNKVFFQIQEQMINNLSKKIVKIEEEIETLVQGNEKINKMHSLITSITGVGSVTSWYMIVATQAFTKFDTSRKFASYCGIAPFEKSSGTSIRGKTQVSHLANKNIKSLLDQCAKTALQYNPEIRQYYKRRIKKGKNKMSTINIIRNKLVSRMFAVVKRGTPYVDTLKYAA